MEAAGATSTNPALSTRIPNTRRASVVSSRSFVDLSPAHRRQLNREPSPDRLAFQIARTTISPNYLGEELETLDREILVVSADVPPQDGETGEQCQERENTYAISAARRQQELAAAIPGAGQQPGQQPLNVGQVNDNTGQQAPAAPAAPQQ
jgi:hypothetical protein